MGLLADANVAGGLLGGALIGLASVAMLLLIGRIAGVSGIFGGTFLVASIAEIPWRAAFVVGLVLGAVSYRVFWGPLPLELQAEGGLLAAAGFLVGVGTRVGSGCTSGHGVCGIARRSRRSVAATVTFIAVAMLTVLLTRHVIA